MNIALRPRKPFLHFSHQNLKWVSTYSAQTPPFPPPHPANHLTAFLNGQNPHNPLDYELSIVSALKSCSSLLAISHGQQIHSLVLKSGLESNVFIRNSLINMYAKCGCIGEAKSLFDTGSGLDSVSYNIMIGGYVRFGRLGDARELFDVMPKKGCVSYTSMILGLVQNGCWNEAVDVFKDMWVEGVMPNELMAFHEGKQFHSATIKTGFDCFDFIQATIIHFYAACHKICAAQLQFELGSKDHVASWNALVAGLVRNGKIELARQLFNEIPERDVISWSSMISGYSQSEQPNMAVELFHEMVSCGVKPNEITMVSVLSAIATLGILKEGRQAHEYIRNNSIPLNDNLLAAIIDMYAKCGSIKTALHVFHQIKDKTCSVSPWNAIICGLAMHGHAQLSLQMYSDLQKRNIKPSAITFIGVLCACCHSGLVALGEQHFNSMKTLYGVEPNIKHYGCMVDLLGKAGRLAEAEKLIRGMPMKADVVIWGSLLAACRTHGNVEVGEWAAESLAGVEPSHGGSRVLLSNIYADAGRWEDAFLVRRAMKSQQMARSPGYSGVI
ncbi:hypothetical protein C3L33_12768, partial [Rhododendron williamsianum]